jgi:hypothetical protein
VLGWRGDIDGKRYGEGSIVPCFPQASMAFLKSSKRVGITSEMLINKSEVLSWKSRGFSLSDKRSLRKRKVNKITYAAHKYLVTFDSCLQSLIRTETY